MAHKNVFVCCHPNDSKEYKWLITNFSKSKIPKSIPTAYKLNEVKFSLMNSSLRAEEISKQDTLVVICSIDAAKDESNEINHFIKFFKQRSTNVLAVIIKGEPNAKDNVDNECFPKALKFKVNENGEYLGELQEPIATDKRDSERDAILKLQAGILGVKYRDLKQRDLKRIRVKRLAYLTMFSLLFLFTINQLMQSVFPTGDNVNEEEMYEKQLEEMNKYIAQSNTPEANKKIQLAMRIAMGESLGEAETHEPDKEIANISSEIDSLTIATDEKIMMLAYAADTSFKTFSWEVAEKEYTKIKMTLTEDSELLESKKLNKIYKESMINLVICQFALGKSDLALKGIEYSKNILGTKEFELYKYEGIQILHSIFYRNLLMFGGDKYQELLNVYNGYYDKVVFEEGSKIDHAKMLLSKSLELQKYRKYIVAEKYYNSAMEYLNYSLNTQPDQSKVLIKGILESISSYERFTLSCEVDCKHIFKNLARLTYN